MEERKVSLSSPDITELEIQKVIEVLRTPNLSRGPKTKEFEEMMASFMGVPHAISVNSGTSGLHLAVKSLGLGDGDEVITTPLSFISSGNVLLMERAKPVFVDIDLTTYNIDPEKIEESITPRTKAILPVDIFGYPVDMDGIEAIAEKHGLYVIEDACNAIGAKYKGVRVGGRSDISVLAFYPNKQITTGEGGMILTSDEETANLCRSMRCHGNEASKSWVACERLGYNYHMDEMSAALGVAQLSRIDEILEKRRKVAEMYKERLNGLEGISLRQESPEVEVSWFIFPVRIHSDRDLVMDRLRQSGVECREYFPAIHLQPFYRRKLGYREGDFPIAEEITSQNVALPFYNNLREEDVDYVVDKLKKAIKSDK